MDRKVKPGTGPSGYSGGNQGLSEPSIRCTQTLCDNVIVVRESSSIASVTNWDVLTEICSSLQRGVSLA
jgi:hypothetical protein